MIPTLIQAKNYIRSNADVLTDNIIQYGSQYHYVAHKSRSVVAWKDAIINLSDNLCAFLALVKQSPNTDTSISAQEASWAESIKPFFLNMAIVHKQKGIEAHIYLGLMKYYRQAYNDLIDKLDLPQIKKKSLTKVINNYFDYAEIFSLQAYQSQLNESELTQELIKNTRTAVYQRNHLISVLETIAIPTFCVDTQGYIRHSNHQGYELLPEYLRTNGADSSWLNTIAAEAYHIEKLISDYQQHYQTYCEKGIVHHRTQIGERFYEFYLSQYSENDGHINDDNIIVFLRDISDIVANEMALRKEKQQRLADQQEIISILGEVLESRSGETGLHVKRVSNIAGHLAKLYGLDNKQVELIKTVAPLHDVGKIAIPDNILNKPGKLTDEEFDLIKTHSEIGYNILQGYQSELTQIASIIAHEHHEKWNGRGYPCGKSGKDIHLYARIIAIADVFDALLSARPYKEPWPKERVFDLFTQENGQHFDPSLTRLLLDNFDSFFELHTDIEAMEAQEQWQPIHLH